MFAVGILNHSVERVVKGPAYALLCFALLWGWGLASFVVAAVYCSAVVRCERRRFRADQSVRRSGSVSTDDSKGYHFSDFLQDLCCARQQMQCDFHAIEFIHFGGLLLYKNAAGRSEEKSDRRDS